jgi:hypothetical protein
MWHDDSELESWNNMADLEATKSCWVVRSVAGRKSVLKVCHTTESSHHHLGAVLFDVVSSTSYLRFNWDVPEIICFVGQRSWMERKTVHWPLFMTEWKRLLGRHRHRWKIVTSCYIRCAVADRIGLAQGACKPRMNECALCNVGSFCACVQLLPLQEGRAVGWMTKE